ncbi:hypothetical protein Q4E93_29550 [Flavitalea sp. BT771]|uniref:hypothetical protein n=1 Tax=Flavitalea sp. BT771 TaxID=3063329 RepID=UPI0026E3BA84|nr:hypothetical protein [Flavitalea sp. BT771]MDO6434794.1 hypothetical protein [Flavitalea sp. BT771]MDV6223694.1 hypothetical protein [Flavitalea sp. BT771]
MITLYKKAYGIISTSIINVAGKTGAKFETIYVFHKFIQLGIVRGCAGKDIQDCCRIVQTIIQWLGKGIDVRRHGELEKYVNYTFDTHMASFITILDQACCPEMHDLDWYIKWESVCNQIYTAAPSTDTLIQILEIHSNSLDLDFEKQFAAFKIIQRLLNTAREIATSPVHRSVPFTNL